MSFPISISKTSEQAAVDPLLTLTRTAIGLGLGILLADKIKPPLRQVAAIALVAVGAWAAVPVCALFEGILATAPTTTSIEQLVEGHKHRYTASAGLIVGNNDNDAGYSNASATESASSLPGRVSAKLPCDSRSNPSAINSFLSRRRPFSSAAETPSRVRSESAIRSVRFMSEVRVSAEPVGDCPVITR